jgi:hypothetical protein
VESVRRIRRLVEEHGRLGAIERSGEDRKLIEIAAAFGADEEVGLPSFLYSGWCLAALPHSKLPDDQEWRLENGPVVLLVEPGRRALPGQPTAFVGVPYGSTARLLLIFLQDRALKTGSRRVELGPSMNSWFKAMDKTAGGNSYRLVRQQAERIGLCRFSFHSERDGVRAFKNQSIVEEGMLFLDNGSSDFRQSNLFREGVVLSESFFKALTEHAVPLERRALRQISDSSLAIDIYCWLSYRLHSLRKPLHVSWAALHGQFGRGYSRLRDFRRVFLTQGLPAALTVYPEAAEKGIEITDAGLIMRQVRPPVLDAA